MFRLKSRSTTGVHCLSLDRASGEQSSGPKKSASGLLPVFTYLFSVNKPFKKDWNLLKQACKHSPCPCFPIFSFTTLYVLRIGPAARSACVFLPLSSLISQQCSGHTPRNSEVWRWLDERDACTVEIFVQKTFLLRASWPFKQGCF